MTARRGTPFALRLGLWLGLRLGLCTLAACSGSQFGGGGGGSPKGPKQNEKQESGTELGTEGEADPEDESTDPPVMVSGAFLACVDDPSLGSDDSETGVGCVVKTKDGEKVDLGTYDKIEWLVLSVFNIEVPATFTTASASSPYNATARLPTFMLSTYKVRLRVERSGKTAELYSGIGAATGGTGDANSSELGQNEDFQLGDDSYDYNKNIGCNDRLGAVSLRGHGLRVPFEVKGGESTVAVSLRDLCGITYANTNVVVISNATARLSEGAIASKATAYEAKGLVLPAGNYKLDILSHDTSSGRDDFIVGRIVFTNTGEVVIGKPTPLADF